MLTPMKIRPGVHVKVKPSTCKKLKLNPAAFFRVRSVLKALAPVQGMRNGVRGTMYPHQQVEIETSPEQHMFPQTGYLQCQLVGIEDVVLATPEEMTPPKRYPVDRVAVLLRLRRDFCLREGHYPTVDHKARAAAREEARRIAYWANFQEKLEPFNPVFDRLMPWPDRFVVAAHGPTPMTAVEHDEAEKRLLAREAAVEAKTLTFEALQVKGIPVSTSEWADLLKMKEEQVCRAMGITAAELASASQPNAQAAIRSIEDRDAAKRAEFRAKFGGFSPNRR